MNAPAHGSMAIRGHVVRGDQRGRGLGFPTANIPTSGTRVPADGVYAGWLRRLDGKQPRGPLPAAISFGRNPTFDGERHRRVESHVLGRHDLDLYGVEVEVTFAQRLRGTMKFTSIEELVRAVRSDIERASRVLRVALDESRGPS